MKTIIIYSTILLLLTYSLISCKNGEKKNDYSDGKKRTHKSGILLNGCGPDDGLAVRIFLVDEEIDCSGSPGNLKNINTYLNVEKISKISENNELNGYTYIVSSKKVMYPAMKCNKNYKDCKNMGQLKLKIYKKYSDHIKGRWEIIKNDVLSQKGEFTIKLCKGKPICG